MLKLCIQITQFFCTLGCTIFKGSVCKICMIEDREGKKKGCTVVMRKLLI